jgi:hypothetical protein
MTKSFLLKVKDYNEDGQIVTVATKEFYNLDNTITASKWVRPNKKGTNIDMPILKNACSVCDKGTNTYSNDAVGTFYTVANDIQHNPTCVSLFSANFSCPGVCIVNSENFNRVVALFAARKLIDSNWINQKDEYMVPNVNHPEYQQWNNDCVIFSLFHSASNQSSLRQIDYKDKKWDIINQWFWMNNNDIKELANTHNNLNIYNDCQQFPNDSFVYKTIQSLKLSDDALQVLSMAKELVIRSFPYRKNADDKYHLNAWDAGWYQIKNGILKDFFADDLKAFSNNFKQFGNRLRDGVYKFGFLK